MRLTIFGATGGTGVRLVRRALDGGDEVTAVVRDPARLPGELREAAGVVQADVVDPAALEEAVKGCDAVITAIGTREGRAPTTVCADSTRAIVAAMGAAGSRRLVVVSASGLDAGPGDDPLTRFVVKPLILQRILKHAFADMRAAEEVVRGSGLDWTIVRPPRLTEGAGAGRYRKAVDRHVPGGFTLAREDLAAALLDLAADASAIGHTVAVAR
ncbi:NAD(P)-dependent oxidoreductase [Actinomadura livida]|uniref:Putative NADH-flavin reductase n=1 Tax=Actinomadura livida TaxID=79909 RepID=A0A7W7IG57_9ACTN|nr:MULTISPECIES: NAD(P)H-binding protein [Actinomadura]MBB4776380.1 putative NADH-flavin reductase [Actinomadura catellatispora]GGU32815.1 NADH-flavin reductase [Actinomadura livida]